MRWAFWMAEFSGESVGHICTVMMPLYTWITAALGWFTRTALGKNQRYQFVIYAFIHAEV